MVVNSSKEIIGEIKKYMFINNISNNDLAQKMNTSNQNVNNIFRRSNPSLITLIEIINALDASFDFELKKKNE